MNELRQNARTVPVGRDSDLAAAASHHLSGRFQEAEGAYLRILSYSPNSAPVLHLLGSLHGQTGRVPSGIELLERAIALEPRKATYHETLAGLLKRSGQIDDAISQYRLAIQLDPAFAIAHNNLGIALCAREDWAPACDAFREAIRLKSDFAEAFNNLAHALVNRRQFAAAIEAAERAVGHKPNYAQAVHTLALAQAGAGELDRAIESFRRAIQLMPRYADAHNNLANAFRARGKFEEAIAEYAAAVQIKPDYAEAFNNWAVALGETGHCRDAIATCAKAIELRSDFAEAHNTLATLLKDTGDVDGAIDHLQKALAIKPDYPEAENNLAVALKDQGRLDEAIEHARRSLKLDDNHPAHSNLIYLLHFHPNQTPASILAEQQTWARKWHAQSRPSASRPRDGRLRVGYVSPYFHSHVVGLNVLPLIQNHDRERFEVFLYSDGVRSDAVTDKFRSSQCEWRQTRGLSDDRVADLVRADGIDILVDLCLHLAGNRLPVFARRPAGAQITFAGYPSGTGLNAMNYRITDAHLDPPGTDTSAFLEKPLRISSFWCFDESAMTTGMREIPKRGELPANRAGFVTYGCLSNFCKINDGVLRLWAQVMHATPASRLMMLAPPGHARIAVIERFAQLGVDASRIDFVSHTRREDYLQLYNRIDIGLDPFPYNGHTTSLDSLWMGVPIVTLAGTAPVGRAGVSQLSNLGITQWIAASPEEYVQIAQRIAGDVKGLAEVRSELPNRMRASVLMDPKRFAAEIESHLAAIALNTTR